MADTNSYTIKPLSRRRLLRMGAAAGGSTMLGLALLASPSTAATSKVSKQTVNYQQTPRGNARCASCSFFQAPSACNYVEGPINPAGWCTLYRPKS